MFAVEWLMVLLLAEIQMKRTSVFLLFEPTVYYAVVAPFFFFFGTQNLCCVVSLFFSHLRDTSRILSRTIYHTVKSSKTLLHEGFT